MKKDKDYEISENEYIEINDSYNNENEKEELLSKHSDEYEEEIEVKIDDKYIN